MTHRLRVALFSGNYNYQADGANKTLNRLVDFLERQGVQVKVFSPTTETPAFEPAGELISVPSVPVPGRGEYRIGRMLTRQLKSEITDFAPDIIHLSSPDLLGHSALSFAEQAGIPAVASFHTRFDTYFRYYGLKFLERLVQKRMGAFYRRCGQIFVPGESVAKVLQQDGIIGSQYHIMRRGIDRQRFHPELKDYDWRKSTGIQDHEIVLTFVGRLVREKGLIEYAGLFDSLKKKELPVRALIIGDGPEFDNVRKRLPEAIMLGHQTGKALSRAFASGDIFVNPSLTETFGNVTLEAMASGLPTVCVNATGSADLVKHGKTGWLVESADHLDFVDLTAQLCRSAEQRAEFGNAGRVASHEYDWDEIMAGVLREYRNILSKKPQLPIAAE